MIQEEKVFSVKLQSLNKEVKYHIRMNVLAKSLMNSFSGCMYGVSMCSRSLHQWGWDSWLSSYGFLSFIPESLRREPQVVMFTCESLMVPNVWPSWNLSPEDLQSMVIRPLLWHVAPVINCDMESDDRVTHRKEGVLYNHSTNCPWITKKAWRWQIQTALCH